MFKNLSSLFGSKKAAEPKPTPPAETQYRAEPRVETSASYKAPAPETSLPKEEPVSAPAPQPEPVAPPAPVKKQRAVRAPAPSAPAIAPETLCGITAEMSHQEIYARLATLYRRYNRATSSLNAPLRSEAEQMLNAIVAVRERIWGLV